MHRRGVSLFGLLWQYTINWVAHRQLPHGSGGWEVQDQGARRVGVGESLLPGLGTTPFFALRFLYKSTNSIHGASPSWPEHPPKAPAPIPTHWGWINMNFGGHKHSAQSRRVEMSQAKVKIKEGTWSVFSGLGSFAMKQPNFSSMHFSAFIPCSLIRRSVGVALFTSLTLDPVFRGGGSGCSRLYFSSQKQKFKEGSPTVETHFKPLLVHLNLPVPKGQIKSHDSAWNAFCGHGTKAIVLTHTIC